MGDTPIYMNLSSETVYPARAHLEERRWVQQIETAATQLELAPAAEAAAIDLFLSQLPTKDRSKPALIAASLYAGCLIRGDGRSQGAIAEAVGVSRLSVQQRWKPLLEDAGFDPPGW